MKVIVEGLPQSGKTVLAELLGDVLVANGFDVVMETDEDEDENPDRQAAAVAALAASGIQILVQERDAKLKKRNQEKPQPNRFTGKDETIQCASCNHEFLFTAKEQDFFKSKGLDKSPKRCSVCRKNNRTHNARVAQ